LEPLDPGYVYVGPTQATANSCRCSSVYYSLVSACGYCQGRSFIRWSLYNANCSTVYVAVYNQDIPVGVKVPAYAYQNVSILDTFNVTLAQSMGGIESSRSPSATSSSAAVSSTSSGSNNIPAIVGGVIGGVAFLGILAILIVFFLLRSKRKRKSQNYKPSSQQSPKMAFTPNTTASLIPSTMSPPPGSLGSAGKFYDPNDPTTYPSNLFSPYQQQSPSLNQNVTPDYTGNSAPHSLPPQTMPQNTGGRPPQYTGVPEL